MIGESGEENSYKFSTLLVLNTNTAIPAGGTHLEAFGTSKDESRSQRRKTFGILLLISSYNRIESGLGHKEICLVCGAHLDPRGNHSVFCEGGTWAVKVTHTILKRSVKEFLVAVAANKENTVTNVFVEAKDQLANNDRPGDVAGRVKVKGSPSKFLPPESAVPLITASPFGKVIEDADAVKRKRYEKQCRDSGDLFFTFGIDAEGRVGQKTEDTIRLFTNLLMGDNNKLFIFSRYWVRWSLMGVLALC